MTDLSNEPSRYRWDGTGLQPGDELLACTAATGFVMAFAEFAAASGLGHANLLSTPCLMTPLPWYPTQPDTVAGADTAVTADDVAVGALWTDVTPAALWHPLFWLPVWLWPAAGEDDDTWAVRVGLVLQSAGLYDPDLGWRDVLYAHHIDLTDPAQQDRVAAWLRHDPAARTDPVSVTLDQLTLVGELPMGQDRALWSDTATAVAVTVRGRARALIAADLLVETETAEPVAEPGVAMEILTEVAMLGDALLADVPVTRPRWVADPDNGQVINVEQTAEEFWARMVEAADTLGPTPAPVQVLDEMREELLDWLSTIRAHHWPSVRELEELTSDQN